jgi:hypothetical protein
MASFESLLQSPATKSPLSIKRRRHNQKRPLSCTEILWGAMAAASSVVMRRLASVLLALPDLGVGRSLGSEMNTTYKIDRI